MILGQKEFKKLNLEIIKEKIGIFDFIKIKVFGW